MDILKRSLLPFFIFLALTPGVAAPQVDPESMECLRCHDEQASMSLNLDVCPIPECNHPLGVDYAAISAKNPTLREPDSLNPAVKLVNGRIIGCTTCHVPYDEANHLELSEKRALYPEIADPMLSMENRKSELCLACHRK